MSDSSCCDMTESKIDQYTVRKLWKTSVIMEHCEMAYVHVSGSPFFAAIWPTAGLGSLNAKFNEPFGIAITNTGRGPELGE